MQENKITQVHGTTPQEIREGILSDFRAELQKFSLNFKPAAPPTYLTRQEVAKILKISLVTISDWNRKGILKPYRLGNLVRYKSSELDQALISMKK